MVSAQSHRHQLNLHLDQKEKKKVLVFLPFPLFSTFLSKGDPTKPDAAGGSAMADLKKHLRSDEILNASL